MLRPTLFLYVMVAMTTLAQALTSMPDPALRAWVAAHYPGAISGQYIDETHPGVQAEVYLDLGWSGTIHDLTGIEAFVNATGMDVSHNPIAQLYAPTWMHDILASNCALSGPLHVPPGVYYLNVSYNTITSLHLPFFGGQVNTVNASHNQITAVEGLEWGIPLGTLNLSYNALTNFLYELPANMVGLDLSHNQIPTLPATGYEMQYLNVSYNQIQQVGQQFGGSIYLLADLSHNQITSVGDLSGWMVRQLALGWNPLQQGITQLPTSLVSLELQSTQLPCLPWLPQGLQTLQCTGNGFTCLPNMPPSLSLAPANFGFTPALCGQAGPCYIVPPQLRLRVCLQGPWNEQAQLMRDDLRSQGLLPLTEPYSAMGWSYTLNTAPLTVPPSRFAVTGTKAIVDWVVVEVREGGMPGTLRQSMPALLRRDGYVVSTTGDSLIRLNVARGNYRVAVKHRNHLAGINFSAQPFWSGPTVIDLMYPNTTQVNFYSFYHAPNGVRMLAQGDITGDHVVKYTGVDNDRDRVLLAIGGVVPTNIVSGQYRREDVNLDGVVKYTGENNDRDRILQIIGGVVPTNIRTQVPVY